LRNKKATYGITYFCFGAALGPDSRLDTMADQQAYRVINLPRKGKTEDLNRHLVAYLNAPNVPALPPLFVPFVPTKNPEDATYDRLKHAIEHGIRGVNLTFRNATERGEPVLHGQFAIYYEVLTHGAQQGLLLHVPQLPAGYVAMLTGDEASPKTNHATKEGRLEPGMFLEQLRHVPIAAVLPPANGQSVNVTRPVVVATPEEAGTDNGQELPSKEFKCPDSLAQRWHRVGDYLKDHNMDKMLNVGKRSELVVGVYQNESRKHVTIGCIWDDWNRLDNLTRSMESYYGEVFPPLPAGAVGITVHPVRATAIVDAMGRDCLAELRWWKLDDDQWATDAMRLLKLLDGVGEVAESDDCRYVLTTAALAARSVQWPDGAGWQPIPEEAWKGSNLRGSIKPRALVRVQLDVPDALVGTLSRNAKPRTVVASPTGTPLDVDVCAVYLRSRLCGSAAGKALLQSDAHARTLVATDVDVAMASLAAFTSGAPMHFDTVVAAATDPPPHRVLPRRREPQLLVIEWSARAVAAAILSRMAAEPQPPAAVHVIVLFDLPTFAQGMDVNYHLLLRDAVHYFNQANVVDVFFKGLPMQPLEAAHQQLGTGASVAIADLPAFCEVVPADLDAAGLDAAGVLDPPNAVRQWLREGGPPSWNLLAAGLVPQLRLATRAVHEILDLSRQESRRDVAVFKVGKFFGGCGLSTLLKSVAYGTARGGALAVWVAAEAEELKEDSVRRMWKALVARAARGRQRLIVLVADEGTDLTPVIKGCPPLEERGGIAVAAVVAACQRNASHVVSPFLSADDVDTVVDTVRRSRVTDDAMLEAIRATAKNGEREDRHIFVLALAILRGKHAPASVFVRQVWESVQSSRPLRNALLLLSIASAFGLRHARFIDDRDLPDELQFVGGDVAMFLRERDHPTMPHRSFAVVHPFLARLLLRASYGIAWPHQESLRGDDGFQPVGGLDAVLSQLITAWTEAVSCWASHGRRDSVVATVRHLLFDRSGGGDVGQLQFSRLVQFALDLGAELAPEEIYDAVCQLAQAAVSVNAIPQQTDSVHGAVLRSRVLRHLSAETGRKKKSATSHQLQRKLRDLSWKLIEGCVAEAEAAHSASLGGPDEALTLNNLAVMHGVAARYGQLEKRGDHQDKCDEHLKQLRDLSSTPAMVQLTMHLVAQYGSNDLNTRMGVVPNGNVAPADRTRRAWTSTAAQVYDLLELLEGKQQAVEADTWNPALYQ